MAIWKKSQQDLVVPSAVLEDVINVVATTTGIFTTAKTALSPLLQVSSPI